MALRLGDVEKNHKQRQDVKPDFGGVTLKPWQGLEQRDDVRRVKKSELAISRAREIAKRNNEMAQKLRDGFVGPQIAEGLERELAEREKALLIQSTDGAWGKRVAIKKGFMSFIKDVFRPSELN